jgi:ADP-ribosyl-[dinitrogen reductase] hydrolase
MGFFSVFNKKATIMSSGKIVTNQPAINRHTSSTSSQNHLSIPEIENRLKGAIWSFFAGDALASPTHWYYGGERQIISEYGHKISDYTKPNKKLAGSILNKSDLNGGGRSKSMSTSITATIIGDIINHGKQKLWSPNESNHYHGTLQRGENTLEVSLARVLMKSIVNNDGIFDADHFRDAYINFMTTPGSHNDTYASTCHRMFFANMIFRQLPPKDCPDNDHHNVDTMDGLILPTIVALAGIRTHIISTNNNDNNINPKSTISNDEVQKSAAECAAVTRRSSVLEGISSLWATVVLEAVRNPNDDEFLNTFNVFSKQAIKRPSNPHVRDSSTMSACYLSSSLPGLVDMVAKYMPSNNDNDGGGGGDRVWQGLLANANVGGENVHRGSIMGAILGARAGLNQIPSQLVNGLYPLSELEKEIDDFVRAVVQVPPTLKSSDRIDSDS